MTVYSAYIKTPLGICEINGSDKGIESISILDNEIPASSKIPEQLQDCATQLHEYFQGNRKVFKLKLNPKGTPFQQEVWNSLEEIQYGQTRSYLEQTRILGDEKAIRAVASANGKNPLWIVLPCHRVIGSNGKLTGYAGGLWRKKWLLDHEQGLQQTTLF